MQAERLMGSGGKPLEGPLLITPRVFRDDRGFFFESWNERSFQSALVEAGVAEDKAHSLRFRQDNHSRSSAGVLRGLHYQLLPEPQGKLVRCTLGVIFDVAVDLRRSSSTYGQWCSAELSAANHQQLWLPEGFAHGFLCLSKNCAVYYKCTNYRDKQSEKTIKWNDKNLNINWPIKKPILSKKDALGINFLDF